MAAGLGLEVQKQVDACMASENTYVEENGPDHRDLLSKGLAWKADLEVNDILAHPSNRGGQMLGVEDVWQKVCGSCKLV